MLINNAPGDRYTSSVTLRTQLMLRLDVRHGMPAASATVVRGQTGLSPSLLEVKAASDPEKSHG
jgi:hypothetical protein